MKKLSFILVIFVLVAGGYFVYRTMQKPVKTNTTAPDTQQKSIVYTDEIFTFASDGKQFTVQYSEDGSWARINYAGKEYELPSAISASGAKYANKDESVTFWEHQREAILEINGTIVFKGAKLVENKNSTTTSTDFSLEGTKWQWQETKYADGEITKPSKPEEFIMYFMKEGRFSSSTDCNTVMGTFAIKDNSLNFGQIASTEMACPDKQTQEETYTTMLINVKTIKVNDTEDRLEIGFDGTNKGTMTFIRFLE